jgi:hypothetical protein
MRRTAACVALACFALAACSSSGGKASTPTTAKSKATGNDLTSLVDKAAKASYKVIYQAGGETVVVAQDPPKYSLVQSKTAIYGDGGDTFVECSGTGLAAKCAELPSIGGDAKQSIAGSFGSVASTLFDALAQAGPALGGLTYSNVTIAGRAARCVTVDSKNLEAVVGDALKGTLTICADKETGVLLKSHISSAKGSTDIVAISFGPPTAADFNPPSAPIPVASLDSTP